MLVREGEENKFPIAAMIENHSDARPQWGLAHAQAVFEASVEGGITRFLAVFTDYDEITKIGPIRSSRPYYLDWVKGFDALYLHVGGSPEALEKIKTLGVKSLDQYFQYQYYWRAKDISAPHNVFTSGNLLALALRDKGYKDKIPSYEPWHFQSDSSAGKSVALSEKLTINFSTDEYQAVWKYNQSEQVYYRYHGDVQHLDGDGTPVAARNIVLLYTSILTIDEEGRRQIKTIGSGEAVLFQEGKRFTGKWQKLSRPDPLKIFLEDGTEAAFVPGTIWFEVVSKTFEISY